jgi:phospholipase C
MMLVLATALGPTVLPAFAAAKPSAVAATATPIKHLVVTFQENVSFAHYFGTYPVAANPHGEPRFFAAAGTPSVNGFTNALLNFNPNLNPANASALCRLPSRPLEDRIIVSCTQLVSTADDSADFYQRRVDRFRAQKEGTL